MENLELLIKWIKESDNIVFFGGAGVSTESGIPDFRSNTGLYKKEYQCNGRKVSAEECLSIDFARKHPDIFYDYYINEFLYPNALPNDAHKSLTKLEEMGKLKAIITQNCDSLHQKAGSKNVLELHGSTSSYSCNRCHKSYSEQEVFDLLKENNVARCDCGSFIRPNIVFYGEGLPDGIFDRAAKYVSKADVFIVAGTSLNVYPAAYLMNYYKGNKCILINLQKTPYDTFADVVVHEKCGEVLSKILKILESSN